MRTPEEARRLRALSQASTDEWTDWTFTLPNGRESYSDHAYPHPSAEGGLPDGWSVVSSRTWRLRPVQAEGTFDLCVVRRNAGGWLIVRHEVVRDEGYSRMMWVDLSLDSMYADVNEEVAAATGSDKQRTQEVQQTIASVIAGLFDNKDPVEAAEKTLFALSGSLTHLPRAGRP